ncbi:hypothetical protein BJ878DRAFT_484003, partial [Calycina marina]
WKLDETKEKEARTGLTEHLRYGRRWKIFLDALTTGFIIVCGLNFAMKVINRTAYTLEDLETLANQIKESRIYRLCEAFRPPSEQLLNAGHLDGCGEGSHERRLCVRDSRDSGCVYLGVSYVKSRGCLASKIEVRALDSEKTSRILGDLLAARLFESESAAKGYFPNALLSQRVEKRYSPDFEVRGGRFRGRVWTERWNADAPPFLDILRSPDTPMPGGASPESAPTGTASH